MSGLNADITKHLPGGFSLSGSFEFETGKITAVFGPSGAGKTTLLRLLAGFDFPDEGEIKKDNNIWVDSKKNIRVPAQRRKVGFAFQDFGLFPNMRVGENIRYGIKGNEKGWLQDLENEFEIAGLVSRYPHQLSSGQQQRVALVRALAPEPEWLFMDEPLSALDLKLRLKIQDHLLKIQKQHGLSIVMVSHDVVEVLRMAHKVIRLDGGRIIEQGASSAILSNEKEVLQKLIDGNPQF